MADKLVVTTLNGGFKTVLQINGVDSVRSDSFNCKDSPTVQPIKGKCPLGGDLYAIVDDNNNASAGVAIDCFILDGNAVSENDIFTFLNTVCPANSGSLLGIDTLQTVLDNGNTASGTNGDVSSSFTLDHINGNSNIATENTSDNTATEIEFSPASFSVNTENDGSGAGIGLNDANLNLVVFTPTNSTNLLLLQPVSTSNINVPSPLVDGTYNIPLIINGLTADDNGVLDISSLLTDISTVDLQDVRNADGSITLTSTVTEDGTTVTDTTPVVIPTDKNKATATALINTDYGLSRDVNKPITAAAALSDLQSANASSSNPTYASMAKIFSNRAVEGSANAGGMNPDGSLGYYSKVVVNNITDALNNNGAHLVLVISDGGANVVLPNGKYNGQLLHIDFRGFDTDIQGFENITGLKRVSPITGAIRFDSNNVAYPRGGETYFLSWVGSSWRVLHYNYTLVTEADYDVGVSGYSDMYAIIPAAPAGTTQTVILPAAITNSDISLQLTPENGGDVGYSNITNVSFDLVRTAGIGAVGEVRYSIKKAILA